MALGSDAVPRERGDRGEGREESKQLCKQGRGGSKEGEGQSPENAPSSPLSFVFIRLAVAASSSVPTAVAGQILDNVTHDQNLKTAEEARRAESSRRFQRVHCFRFLKRLRQTLAAWRARIADGISPRTTFKKSGFDRLVPPWSPSLPSASLNLKKFDAQMVRVSIIRLFPPKMRF